MGAGGHLGGVDNVKGRAFAAEVDPRASPGPRPLSNHQPQILVTGG